MAFRPRTSPAAYLGCPVPSVARRAGLPLPSATPHPHGPPAHARAVVTCGGLCPGLNDVVQGVVKMASDYGVPEGNILGIR